MKSDASQADALLSPPVGGKTQMMQPSFYSPLAPPREHYPVGTTTQIAKIF